MFCCDQLSNYIVLLYCPDQPFRHGFEWWLPMEMCRVMLLTSFIGWLAQQCWTKILAAQFIALVFAVLFLPVTIL